MVEETASCEGGLTTNICMSYGSRGEILNASRSLALDAVRGNLNVAKIDKQSSKSDSLPCIVVTQTSFYLDVREI